MNLRSYLAANAEEHANSELAMHVSLMSWVASMDADSFVHFAREIPQRAANLYDNDALSPANVAQVVRSLEGLSEGGSWFEIESKLDMLIVKLRPMPLTRREGLARCPPRPKAPPSPPKGHLPSPLMF